MSRDVKDVEEKKVHPEKPNRDLIGSDLLLALTQPNNLRGSSDILIKGFYISDIGKLWAHATKNINQITYSSPRTMDRSKATESQTKYPLQ